MKFFSYESRFSQLLLKLCYACYLNLLWFVCSIPIVTIGASTTALYYAALKVVRDEDSHVGAAFFRSFRQNFKQVSDVRVVTGLFVVITIVKTFIIKSHTSGIKVKLPFVRVLILQICSINYFIIVSIIA